MSEKIKLNSSPREYRFYIDAPLDKKSAILDQQEHHHLKNVLRCNEGGLIYLINGKGVLATAKIEKITKKETHLTIIELKRTAKLDCGVHLYQALIHHSALDILLEKVTELGILKVFLFPSERTQVKLIPPYKKEHFKSKIVGALKQSHNLFLPEVVYLEAFSPPPLPFYFGSLTEGSKPFLDLAKNFQENIRIVIGPEGGFSLQEEELLKKAQGDAFTLSSHILRAETAAILSVGMASQSVKTPL
jgi:16S rRNA (uracil1498-N3)-methyltransferase